MEKSPFALSVDNSLLDSIHPLSNSNSGKFPAPRIVSVRIVSTNKHACAHTYGRVERPALAPVIRTCTYTSPRNKPRRRRERVDARTHRGCVCLENKNASFETCIPNSTRHPSLLLLLAAASALYPCRVYHRACNRPRVAVSRRRSTTLAAVPLLLAYFSSRIRNVPSAPSPSYTACGFFRLLLHLVPRNFSNSSSMTPRENGWCARAYVQHIDNAGCTFLYIDTVVSIYALSFYSAAAVFQERSRINRSYVWEQRRISLSLSLVFLSIERR